MTYADRITNIVSREYENCPKGTASAFCRIFLLIEGATALPHRDVYAAMEKMFPEEVQAFEAEAEPVYPPHAGRFTITFRPDLN